MQTQPALTERQIESLPISFDLLVDHGGTIWEIQLSNLERELVAIRSFDHFPFSFPSVLWNEGTVCHIILKNNVEKDALGRRLDLMRSGRRDRMVGICVLYFPSRTDKSTAQLGVALLPEARGKGFGRAAVHKLLSYAFDALKVHRVVADVLCPIYSEHKLPRRDATLETKKLCWLFEGHGFRFEGAARAAIPANPKRTLWQDVHRMSMLDTDWVSMQMAAVFAVPRFSEDRVDSTPWGEMERRHEAEREVLAGWFGPPPSSSPPAKGKELDGMGGDDDDATYYGGGGSSDECDDYDDCDN